MEELHEHPAITSKKYAGELIRSWNYGQMVVFKFLLAQADKGDLGEVKNEGTYGGDSSFRKAIDDAFPRAGPAKTRHIALQKESGLLRRHLLKLLAPSWVKRKEEDQRTSSLTT